MPLPTIPTSPAGDVFFSAFYALGATPSEPKLFQAAFDAHGQISGTITSWMPSVGNIDMRVVIARLSASPNGRYLASTYETEGGEATQIIDLSASKLVAFVSAGKFFGWHPDGYEFLFDQEQEADPGLWLVDAHNGQHRLLVQPAGINVSGTAISPDGQILAYGFSGVGIQQIWMANADGSEPRLVLDGHSTGIVYSWSSDGRYLLYRGELQSDVSKGTPVSVSKSPLWVMERNGENRKQLKGPFLREPGFEPVWSPTKHRIAYVGVDQLDTCWQNSDTHHANSLCRFKGTAVFVEDIDTGEFHRVATNAIDPAWSSDGSRLIFAAMDEKGRVDIWVADADGQDLRRITDTIEVDRYPVWIPR
jgi:Tol biopolymer transport system component